MLEHIRQLIELLAPVTSDRRTLDELLRMMQQRQDWPKAHALFGRIRQKTLKAERVKDERLEAQYLFEEVCAKTLYNLSNSPAPFDADSPYWIIPNALAAARHWGIEPARVVAIVAG